MTKKQAASTPDDQHPAPGEYDIARMAASASPLFLRGEEVARGRALLLAAHAHWLQGVEGVLRDAGIGRAHYRVLAHVAAWPGLSVGDLVTLSGTTKQAVGRVLRDLGARDLVSVSPGLRDRRQRLVQPTANGAQLAMRIDAALSARLSEAYAASGQQSVTGFWMVLEGLIPVAVRAHHADLTRRLR